MQAYREALEYREFLKEFTLQQLRSRYRNSVLGFLWTLLNPLLLLATFSFIFSYINRVDLPKYMPMFFAGFIPWTFFTATANTAIPSVVGNAFFFTRVKVPRGIFPIAAVAVNLIDFAATWAVAGAILLAVGWRAQPAVLTLPLSFAILAAFVTGVAFLFALLNVFFRDFGFLWASASFLWFFVTPILYPIEALPEQARRLMQFNPFVPFLRLFQDPIARGTVPTVETWILAGSLAALALIFGVSAYERLQPRFYEYL